MEILAGAFCAGVFAYFVIWAWNASINHSVYGVTKVPKEGSYWRYNKINEIVVVGGCGSAAYCEEVFTNKRSYTERCHHIDYKEFYEVCKKINDDEMEREKGLQALANL